MSEPAASAHPTSRAAPALRRVLAHGRFEASVLLRNGEQLLVSIILPALALVVLALTDSPDLGPGRRVDLAVAGTLALAVASTAFTGQAIGTGFDRRHGVLRLLGTTPLGRDGLIAAKTISIAAVLLIQLVVLGALAAALGWRPLPAGLGPALVSLLLGALAFALGALLLAGTLRAEAVLALANLLWVLFLGLGLLLPTDRLPAGVAAVAAWLPSGALGDGLRTSLVHGGLPLREWFVLIGWALVSGLLARRFFRFSD